MGAPGTLTAHMYEPDCRLDAKTTANGNGRTGIEANGYFVNASESESSEKKSELTFGNMRHNFI